MLNGRNVKEGSMSDADILVGSVMEETWLTLEQVAGAVFSCR